MIITSDPNLTTGTRHYSLYALANQAVFEAEQARLAAFNKAERDPRPETMRAFLKADAAFTKIVEKREQVRLMQKHSRGTVRSEAISRHWEETSDEYQAAEPYHNDLY